MFKHIYKYRILSLVREKVVLFWSLVYPIVLAVMFYATFGSHIGSDSRFEPADICLVMEEGADTYENMPEVISSVEYSEGKKMFSVSECGIDKAEDMLEKGEVIGIVRVSDTIRVEVNGSGLYQSILKMFTDTYLRNMEVYKNLYTDAPERASVVEKIMSETGSALKESGISGAEADSQIQYFYSIIAMACLFGSFVGISLGNGLVANATPVAARKCISSAHRLTVICADMCAAFSIGFVEICMVTLFIRYGLKIDICPKPGFYILICFFGAIIGVAIGQFTAFIARGKNGVQIAISLSFSLVSSFLGGLMVGGIDYLIANVCPIVARINPASLITNSFYCLSVYSDYKRVAINIITLGVEAAVLTISSYLVSRRTRHESI